jgi:FkbH-like protein
MNIIKNKIKLVIWDLDETFWSGTLSEEGIVYNPENHNIVIELAKRGIISSICSKNNFDEVKAVLVEKGLWSYFVFSEIDWKAKGQLVKKIISDMGLRPDNVLFIDDNLGNLNEVSFFNEGISVVEPSLIKSILTSEFLQGKCDSQLSRLEQYKILEHKREAKGESNSSNEDFLKNSDIKVTINNNVIPELTRILELVERTNQLNYTKLRSTKDELVADINDTESIFGYVAVEDKFGSYGISGFYLIKSNKLVHFLFSCRSMNMGVESWLYNYLGRPRLAVVGEVAIDLLPDADYSYIELISSTTKTNEINKNITLSNDKILLVGGCDLDQVVHYLSYSNIDTDFNYINSAGLNVHKEHTTLITQFCLSTTNYDDVLKSIPILDKSDKYYKLFDTDWDYLIYSPLNDYSRGLYKHKKTGFLLPFDSFNINWCDKNNWKSMPVHLRNIPKEFLLNLHENYTFIGAIEPAQFKENLLQIANKFKNKKIIILNGSEQVLEQVKPWEKGMHHRHTLMNQALTELSNIGNLSLINVNEFILSDEDHLDNIRHYRKNIYMDIAIRIAKIFNSNSESNVELKSKVITDSFLLIKKVLRALKRRLTF